MKGKTIERALAIDMDKAIPKGETKTIYMHHIGIEDQELWVIANKITRINWLER